MGIPKNRKSPKWESPLPKMGMPKIKISRNKNPQLVDFPKSRHPMVHLTALTEKTPMPTQPHAAPRTPGAPRHLRCMGQCEYRRTMLRRGVAPHARAHMHMPQRLYRHALTQTDERHSDTATQTSTLFFSNLFFYGTRAGRGRLVSGGPGHCRAGTRSQARTPSQCRTPSRQAPSGSVADLALALRDEHSIGLQQPHQVRLEAAALANVKS